MTGTGVTLTLHNQFLRVGALVILFWAFVFAGLARGESVSDVRVLIDVSGSMKKNDPNNLRTPAVKMLVGLLPEKTQSGIWTFGRYVNMQVKLGQVEKSWKEKAMLAANKIHSRGLYTNLEEAIIKSTSDWHTPDPRFERHLIILTDGVVDVSKDEQLNKKSRRRILNDLLPRLEKADATVHSIALSKNTDEELLNALSGSTKGAFVQVDTAEELQRVFLKLFEKSVKPDTVPIEENKFTVDKHVDDITVLIFLAKDSPATRLTLPDGKTWSQEDHPKQVSWHHEQGYDLITVKEPLAGEWKLQAKVDPDNRVMIVTNLRMKVDKLPNTIMLGDSFDVRARLLQEGKIVTQKKLLEKTEFEIKRIDGNDRVESLKLADDGNAPDVIKGDGVYSKKFKPVSEAGMYELAVRAKGPTFKRSIRHTIQVHDSPANIEITQPASDKPFVIKVMPHVGLIRPDSISMQIKLADEKLLPVKQVDDLAWSVEVPASYANQKFFLTLAGTRYSDEPVKMQFEQTLAVTGKSQSLALKIKPEISKEPEPAATAEKPKEEPKDTVEDAVAKPEKGGFSWYIVLALVIGINAVVIGAAVFGFRQWNKKQKQTQDAVEGELTA